MITRAVHTPDRSHRDAGNLSSKQRRGMIGHWLRALYGAWAIAAIALLSFLIFFPLIIVMPSLGARRSVARWGSRAVLWAAGVPLTFSGDLSLLLQPAVVVSNHSSYLDGLILTAVLPPRCTFLVHQDAAATPYVGWVLRRLGIRFVQREEASSGARSYRNLLRMLRCGETIVIFPEGYIGTGRELLPFKHGGFIIAARACVPVVPVVINGSHLLFPAGARLPKPARVEVSILPEVQYTGGKQLMGLASFVGQVRNSMLRHRGIFTDDDYRLDNP